MDGYQITSRFDMYSLKESDENFKGLGIFFQEYNFGVLSTVIEH